jgi:hypothetical protein
MSQAKWLIAAVVPGIERQPLKRLNADEAAVLKLLHRWRDEANQAGHQIKRIVVAYEAGRDGFCLLVRLYALDSVDIDPLRADLMARLEYHRDRLSRFEHILKKRFPNGAASTADTGKLLGLRMGLRYERAVAEWCEEALDTLSAGDIGANVTPIDGNKRETNR